MPILEFTIEGPPFSINQQGKGPKQTKNKRLWHERVRNAALAALPDGYAIINVNTFVHIAYYYDINRRDIDNIVKPILDALGEKSLDDRHYHAIVWNDDNMVNRLLVELYHRPTVVVENPSALIASALDQFSEIVYVRIEWEAA